MAKARSMSASVQVSSLKGMAGRNFLGTRLCAMEFVSVFSLKENCDYAKAATKERDEKMKQPKNPTASSLPNGGYLQLV